MKMQFAACWVVACALKGFALSADKTEGESPKKWPTVEVSKKTLQTLRSVRTSDITDALDSMGLQERYQMDTVMRPLYTGIRFAGIAHTAEYELIVLTSESTRCPTRSSTSGNTAGKIRSGERLASGAAPIRCL